MATTMWCDWPSPTINQCSSQRLVKKKSLKPTELTLNLKNDDIDKNKTSLNQFPLQAQLVIEAQLMLIRVSQYDSHKDEIQKLHAKQKIPRSSKLWRFRPFCDEQDSVIRIAGRAPSADLVVQPASS